MQQLLIPNLGALSTTSLLIFAGIILKNIENNLLFSDYGVFIANFIPIKLPPPPQTRNEKKRTADTTLPEEYIA